ncbi:MAG TPA: NADPH-dependent glutamate synthase [Spirochaetia bacterium]|nr:NADPH-dependent glutamate synthase [Spirochaetales bacterium]HRY72630.1 NADPH-dependent glutamate synthase [Spirochaetia bacterium]
MSEIDRTALERGAEEELAKVRALRLGGRDLSPRERLALPSQDMPCQDPGARAANMFEVSEGYSEAQARLEAERCLSCRNAPCVAGCPVGVDIPGFIGRIREGDFEGAARVIKRTNLLPSICGRVCPQEKQCQAPCTVGKSLGGVEKAVQIGRLERYVADRERACGLCELPDPPAPSGKRVAVVGSGPAGLTCAADLRREGHAVVVYEAFQKAGGVMVYGIPEFRLPKELVRMEAETLASMGVRFELNFLVGRTRPLKALLSEDGFDAVFVGTGAGLPKFMEMPGENLVGVFSANEYLTRANLMRAYDRPRAATPIYPSRRVAVLGGGNVAMDAARTALRLGAEESRVLYRRTRDEMPARAEEVVHAMEEGVAFDFLTSPTRVLAGEDGRAAALEILSYELGEPDASGRRSPVPIRGSERVVPFDTVIVAIGNESNPLLARTTPELKVDRRGHILVDERQKTSIDRVYAGGDIVLGAATVILAMGEGRRAAAAINEVLQ